MPNKPTSSWLWRSCTTQPRTLSFRHEPHTPPPSSSPSDADDQTEAIVRALRPGERLFLELEETNSIMAAARCANSFPFRESVAVAMESREPYVDFRRSMEEMVQAHGVKNWKRMEELLRWYLAANGKNNHEFIIGAFVDLMVDRAWWSFCDSPSWSALSSSFASSSSSSSSSLSAATTAARMAACGEVDGGSVTPGLSSLFEDDEEFN